jgi:acyl-CoA reductase-like NAD-dependent aldehyde dehydrogenase
MSTDRIVLHSAIAPAFLAALKAALSSDPPSEAPTLVSAASKARVQSLVSSSLAAGAHLIHGSVDAAEPEGKASSIRLAPIVVGGAGDEDPLWLEESFASLAACRVVSSDEEAVRVANSGGYGLSAAVFTEDLRRGFRIAKMLESG